MSWLQPEEEEKQRDVKGTCREVRVGSEGSCWKQTLSQNGRQVGTRALGVRQEARYASSLCKRCLSTTEAENPNSGAWGLSWAAQGRMHS